jgi:1,4-dihydroxy-2-naphthoate octaprenyltransferase
MLSSIIQHLRFPFSLMLSPVYLFAWSQQADRENIKYWILFIILHLLVYPASNAFNSIHDRDIGSIGGIKNPLPISSNLSHVVNAFDILSIFLTLIFLGWLSFSLVFTYILISRLYSHRSIRLKKNPFLSVAIVSIFQGAFIYLLCGLISDFFTIQLWAMLAVSLQLAAIYPMTQIYQHESDLADGVKTFSYILGIKNTFLWFFGVSAFAITGYFFHFRETQITVFYQLLLAFAPAALFSGYWFWQVTRNAENANFKNTMILNIFSALSLNIFFLLLFLK